MSIFFQIIFPNLNNNFIQLFHFSFRRNIKDTERKELLDNAMSFCVQSFKNLLQKYGEQRNDNEILTLIIEIFKAHKKIRNVSQKESPFSNVLVDTFKLYAEGKVWLQENVNHLDRANKFCVSLTNSLKNQEKQQQLTGSRQTLEELALRHLSSSISRANSMFSAPINPNTNPTTNTNTNTNTNANVSIANVNPNINLNTNVMITANANNINVSAGNQTPTGGRSPAILKVATSSVTSITTTTSNTTAPIATPITTTMTATAAVTAPTGRRGRPPGSKNSTTKSDASKSAAMQQKLMASILQPLAGSLSSLDLITAHLEPSVKSTVLALIAEPKFMKTLAMFPDPTSRNTLLQEYFSISNFPNVQQLIDGFNSVFNYLATILQPQTSSLASLLQPQMKAPKAEKAPSVPKSSTMSIFPTTSKPHPSLSTSPSKPNVNTSISATITPVPSSSLLKSGASTVISVGSGQLTITPSISITPNPTKLTPALPQMPAPSFNIQKTTQPKARRSTGEKTTKASQKMQRLSQGAYRELTPISIENLPKSLSIIPSPNAFGAKSELTQNPLPINVDLFTNKPAKQTKSKKKSIDGNKAQLKMPTIDPNLFNKSMAAQLNPLNPLMSQYNFLSHYEQFLSSVPAASLQLPKPSKSKQTNTVTSGAAIPQQKASIKVKQLDQLQARKNPPKVKETSVPKSKQTFTTPNMSKAAKNPPSARSPAVLNAYGTTISSVPIPSQTIPSSYPTMPTTASNLATNLQIR